METLHNMSTIVEGNCFSKCPVIRLSNTTTTRKISPGNVTRYLLQEGLKTPKTPKTFLMLCLSRRIKIEILNLSVERHSKVCGKSTGFQTDLFVLFGI